MNNYYNTPLNQQGVFPPPYYPPEQVKKDEIRSKCSHIGFFLVIAVVVMNIVAIVMELIIIFTGQFDITMKTGMQGIPYTDVFLMNGLAEFTAFFAAPIVFCLIKKFPISETVPLKNNKKYNIFAMMIAGFSVCVLANIAVSILNLNLGLFGFDNNFSMEFGSDTLQEKLLYFFCVAIVPALTEEFTFRGLVLNYLKPYGNGFAILVSSVLFGLVHGNFVQIPFAFLVGLVCGFLTVKTGTIIPAILLHLLNNGTSVLLDIASKAVGSETGIFIEYGAMAVLLIISFASLLFLIIKRDLDFKLENENFERTLSVSDKVKCFLSSGGIITALVIFGLLAVFAASSSGILESVQQ